MTPPDAMSPEIVPLPDGARIVHVGPHKTGTTAIQASLWAARDELLRQDVRLAGSRNPAAPVRAVVGQRSPYADDNRTPPLWRWNRLAARIRESRESRVIVSSEFFAYAVGDAITRIVDELGHDRLHIIVTLRPLGRVLTSMWQQNVQAGTVASLDEWLHATVEPELERTAEASRQSFWTLERHDELVQRWVDVVGRDRVVGVVVDDRDHAFLLRAFEGLLALRSGTLQPQVDLTNRSLTLPEAESVRAFNRAAQERKVSRGRQARLMRFGAAQVMKQRAPAPGEARVELPAWCVEPVDAIQRRIVDGVRETGIRIVGDLDRLLEPIHAAPPSGEPVSVSPEVAAAMAMGIVVAAGEARTGGAARLQIAEPTQVVDVPTYQIGAVLGLRAVRAVSGTARRTAGRIARFAGRRD